MFLHQNWHLQKSQPVVDLEVVERHGNTKAERGPTRITAMLGLAARNISKMPGASNEQTPLAWSAWCSPKGSVGGPELHQPSDRTPNRWSEWWSCSANWHSLTQTAWQEEFGQFLRKKNATPSLNGSLKVEKMWCAFVSNKRHVNCFIIAPQHTKHTLKSDMPKNRGGSTSTASPSVMIILVYN